MGEEEGGRVQIDLSSLDIEQLLSIFIGILATKAWQYMGLRLIPEREEPERDMGKAALAIDCAAFMADRLAPRLPETEARRLKAMITDLQINYAKNA
ncbi:DUF1844 domain-containing protein [Candidatus Bathyarchaeota archaeon]|nr:DUF1844 domain-containing protein [Candidatus Bathyarchaeota archaeon]